MRKRYIPNLPGRASPISGSALNNRQGIATSGSPAMCSIGPTDMIAMSTKLRTRNFPDCVCQYDQANSEITIHRPGPRYAACSGQGAVSKKMTRCGTGEARGDE